MCSQFGLDPGLWLPLGETIILLGLAFVATKFCPAKNLAGFILAIAAINVGWCVAVPLMEASSVFESFSNHFDWAGRFLVARAIRTVGAILLLLTLVGSGISRRDLFLTLGDWRAQVQPEPFLRFHRAITWTGFTAILLVVFEIVLPLFLASTLRPQIGRFSYLISVLPLAVITSALNAANEEFQFRSVLLARLKNVLPNSEAFLLCGLFFGASHYFGQPSGWAGVFMAAIAGWAFAKSMVETRGFTCAFVIHFVQDIVIFGFLAMSISSFR